MGWKILLPQEIKEEGRKLLEDNGHTLIDGRGFEPEDVLADLKEYQPDAMIIRITPINREILEADPNLKVVVRHGAGYDSLDVQACWDNNIQALYVPTANSTSVAETAMLLILECSKNVNTLRNVMPYDWYKAKLDTPKHIIKGSTLGIIGCGNIGSRVAVRANAMGMKVMAYDPYKPAADFPDDVIVVRDLDQLLSESDYITIHTPATSVTKKMCNYEFFKKMKKTAYFIDTARGSLYVADDLIKALDEGEIAGAGLDVLNSEPTSANNPLLHRDDVFVTPHIGGNTYEAAHRASYFSALSVQRAFEGKDALWPIPHFDYETAKKYTDTRPVDEKEFSLFDTEENWSATRKY